MENFTGHFSVVSVISTYARTYAYTLLRFIGYVFSVGHVYVVLM